MPTMCLPLVERRVCFSDEGVSIQTNELTNWWRARDGAAGLTVKRRRISTKPRIKKLNFEKQKNKRKMLPVFLFSLSERNQPGLVKHVFPTFKHFYFYFFNPSFKFKEVRSSAVSGTSHFARRWSAVCGSRLGCKRNWAVDLFTSSARKGGTRLVVGVSPRIERSRRWGGPPRRPDLKTTGVWVGGEHAPGSIGRRPIFKVEMMTVAFSQAQGNVWGFD